MKSSNMITLEPLFNQILIKPNEHKTILVSDSKSLDENGEVIAIGPDVKQIKVGDRIAFLIWGLNSTEIDGEKFYLVPEESSFILGRVKVQGNMVT